MPGWKHSCWQHQWLAGPQPKDALVSTYYLIDFTCLAEFFGQILIEIDQRNWHVPWRLFIMVLILLNANICQGAGFCWDVLVAWVQIVAVFDNLIESPFLSMRLFSRYISRYFATTSVSGGLLQILFSGWMIINLQTISLLVLQSMKRPGCFLSQGG